MGEFLDHDVLAAEFHPFARRSCRSQEFQLAERKIPLFQAKEHFHADGTRRANNSHMWLIHGSKAGFSEPGCGT
jgi:hypothetical protein